MAKPPHMASTRTEGDAANTACGPQRPGRAGFIRITVHPGPGNEGLSTVRISEEGTWHLFNLPHDGSGPSDFGANFSFMLSQIFAMPSGWKIMKIIINAPNTICSAEDINVASSAP